MPIRVTIVEDDARVREALVEIVNEAPGLRCTAHFDSAENALKHFPGEETDVALVDINLPGRSGIDLLAEIKHRWPKLPVLIMSLHAEEHFDVRALRAGASGYLTKAAAPDELVEAVLKITRGGKYITESLAERLAADLGGRPDVPHERLSDREFDVMRGIAAGSIVFRSSA